jgi:hypothetical protein
MSYHSTLEYQSNHSCSVNAITMCAGIDRPSNTMSITTMNKPRSIQNIPCEFALDD